MPSDKPQTATLQVSTNLNDLNRVLGWFDRFERAHVPQQVWLQVQSALAEAFTNAVRHAHCDRPADTPIVLEFCLGQDWLELRIWDCGDPFDLEAALANLPETVDRRSGGGRGLHILQRVADRLAYDRLEDSRNCLCLYKGFTTVGRRRFVPEQTGVNEN